MNAKRQLTLLPLLLVAAIGYSTSEAAALSGQITVTGQIVEAPCTLQGNTQSINTSCWVNYKTQNNHINAQALRSSNQAVYIDSRGLSIAYKEQRANTHLYQVDYQ
ncbi:hypothetical protein [Pseudomonas sp. 8O]|uniref:hypothetical protein n=1 Tax=Pseudomonas sp. 8O TaxID=2653165 RepID=UPI0012F39BAA|nr:hypothetical protein [Pseudomonas sp. 8O]VXC36486.1 conserved exported hypothetical protein [Pseudomonas sp. 8O]